MLSQHSCFHRLQLQLLHSRLQLLVDVLDASGEGSRISKVLLTDAALRAVMSDLVGRLNVGGEPRRAAPVAEADAKESTPLPTPLSTGPNPDDEEKLGMDRRAHAAALIDRRRRTQARACSRLAKRLLAGSDGAGKSD